MRRTIWVSIVVGLFTLSGCGRGVEWADVDGGVLGGEEAAPEDVWNDETDDRGDEQRDDGDDPFLEDKVYAHSATTLFEIDPEDLTVRVVGDFRWPSGHEDEEMTDIALDEVGTMIGISFGAVYAVDTATAVCTFLANLGAEGFTALSFVEGAGADAGVPALVGVNDMGDAVRIDTTTGAFTPIGAYGGGYGSSGDLVFVRGAGALATTFHSSTTTDVLVSVDPSSGRATRIGDTGFSGIWGLAYWGGDVFGFTEMGEFIIIDPDTGSGTLVEDTDYAFWGAGVTTSAPLVY